jgi:hypothetical protein
MAGVPRPHDMPAAFAPLAASRGCPEPAADWLGEPDLGDVRARSAEVMPAVEQAIADTLRESLLLG